MKTFLPWFAATTGLVVGITAPSVTHPTYPDLIALGIITVVGLLAMLAVVQ